MAVRCEPRSSRGFPRLAAVVLAVLLAVGLAGPSLHAEEEDLAPAVECARTHAGSFVHVEIAVRYDEGQPPTALSSGRSDFSGLVTEERPFELSGIVLAADRVLVSDPVLHPRFVASVHVVRGEQRIPAKFDAWLKDQDGAVLALERPLEGAKEMTFAVDAKPPYRGVWHGKREGAWVTTVGRVLDRVVLDESGEVRVNAWSPALVVDAAANPVGVTLSDQVVLEGTWRGSPLAWPSLSAEERERLVEATKRRADTGLLRAHLRLRSPKAEGGGRRRRVSFVPEDEGDETQRNAVGVVVDRRRVLVLQEMDAKATARLESIELNVAEGPPVPARFVATYKHYGAILVETDQDLPDPVRLSSVPLREQRDRLLLDARFEVQGDRRVLHCTHCRLSTFEESWRRQVVPQVSEGADHFVFDREGALVAFPVKRRSSEAEPRWRRGGFVLLPAEHLVPLLADPASHSDPSNVPVSAERENRLAWLGVEVQPLDRELARINNVSHLTQDGQSGALVSYVYAGSPAERAGIAAGAVLLRIHAPDKPKPIEIRAPEDPFASMRGLLESMEGFEERFGEMMPDATPWPSVENDVNRALTEIGFGRPFTLEYAVDGEVKKADLEVAESPVHYGGSAVHKSEPLGTTVRDLTYEVRRFYQLEEKTPGVIVSKVERGSRAAVAGLRRFDIVLQVNGAPVENVAAFAQAIDSGEELRLTVKDRLKERVVKVAAR